MFPYPNKPGSRNGVTSAHQPVKSFDWAWIKIFRQCSNSLHHLQPRRRALDGARFRSGVTAHHGRYDTQKLCLRTNHRHPITDEDFRNIFPRRVRCAPVHFDLYLRPGRSFLGDAVPAPGCSVSPTPTRRSFLAPTLGFAMERRRWRSPTRAPSARSYLSAIQT